MTKLFARIMALVLALAFCFSIVACTKPQEEPEKTETTATPDAGTTEEPGEVTTPTESEDYVKSDLPELNYKGKEVTVIYWSDVEKLEFVPKGYPDGEWDMADTVQKSLYERNEAVQRKLNIKLKFVGQEGNNKNTDEYLKKVKIDYEGDKEFDISAAYSRTAGKCSTRGYFRDLSKTKYINLEKPWYPNSLIKNLKIGDSLFFISGDASVNTLYLMYTVYYNKDLFKERHLVDPQTLVKDKKWTIDKLIELTTDTYENLNGDDKDQAGSGDLEDFYGFCTIYYGVDAFYTGSGFMLVDNTDKAAVLKISDDFTSEKVQNFTEKLQRWLTTRDCNVFLKSGQYRQPFVNGNALFCQERCYLAENYLIGKEGKPGVTFTYGVLPTPLLDEKQENYITCIGNPFTLYSITKASNASDLDMLSAVIECWSSESYRLSTPAVFEVNMKLKYAKDSVDAQMFDICKETITSDLGRVFSKDLNTMSEIWSKAACSPNANWKSTSTMNSKVLKKLISDIVKEVQGFLD